MLRACGDGAAPARAAVVTEPVAARTGVAAATRAATDTTRTVRRRATGAPLRPAPTGAPLPPTPVNSRMRILVSPVRSAMRTYLFG